MWHTRARAPQPEAPEKRTVAELRAMSAIARAEYVRERKRWLHAWRFESVQEQQVVAHLTRVLERNAASGPGAKPILAVDAVNTTGKSTLVRAWAQAAYREWVGDRITSARLPAWTPEPGVRAHEIPVVWINLQSASKIKDVNAQILEFFGYPAEGPIRSLSTRIVGAVDKHNVRLLVVDDAHLLKTGFREGREVLDHLKHLNTELGERDATMLLIGAEMSDGPIFADPQIAGRLRAVEMAPFAIETIEDKRAWQDFLAGVEDMLLPYLPAASPGLLTRTHASRIWRRTQGFAGDIAELLIHAALQAAVDDSWTIRNEHLADAALSDRARKAEVSLGRARLSVDPGASR